MRLERLLTHRLIRAARVVLPLVVIVLVAIPAWNYLGKKTQKAGGTKIGRQLPSGVSVHTQGFTYSQTEGGRTQFTVHAKELLGFENNKELLGDVDVTVYGATEKDPTRTIHGQNCAYDQETQDIECNGNVEVHLDEKTTVHTEELTYSKRDALVTAPQRATIEQEGTTGQADTLEYGLNSGLLKLDGNVRIDTADDTHVETASAVLQQKENWATMSGGVFIKSENGWIRGTTGRADLVPGTYKPKAVTVDRNVTGESHAKTSGDSWTLRGGWLEATIGPSGRAEHVRTRDNVEVEKIAGNTHQRMSGSEIDTTLKDGRVDVIEARQNAHMVFASDQTLDSTQISTTADGSVRTAGQSVLKVGDSTIEGRDFTIENKDIVTFNTRRRAILKKAGNQESSADETSASFESRTSMLQTLVQTGNFQFHSPDHEGHAQSGEFKDGGTTVILKGSAVVTDSQEKLEAAQIQINQKNNTFVATRNVSTVMKTSQASDAVLVKAEQAESGENSILYTGKVELYRVDVYIKADRLDVSGQPGRQSQQGQSQQNSRLRASALPGSQVHSTLQTIRAKSDTLDYDEATGIIHYAGHVWAQNQDMIVEAPDMTVNFRDNRVTDMTASGGVVVIQADKTGKGERAVYEAATETTTLAGKNAEVRDKARGLIQGAKLKMTKKGETVIVESGNGDRTQTSHPVVSRPVASRPPKK